MHAYIETYTCVHTFILMEGQRQRRDRARRVTSITSSSKMVQSKDKPIQMNRARKHHPTPNPHTHEQLQMNLANQIITKQKRNKYNDKPAHMNDYKQQQKQSNHHRVKQIPILPQHAELRFRSPSLMAIQGTEFVFHVDKQFRFC